MKIKDQIAVAACVAEQDAKWYLFAAHRAATRAGLHGEADAGYWRGKAKLYQRAIINQAKKIEAMLHQQVAA